MEERPLHIVIVGHVDHGKSTLIGRLLYDTGHLTPEKLEEIRRISESLGKEMEFAYVMDHLEEERQRGITIDIAHTFFKTSKRRYVVIDAPGHKEFLKNMISGSSQAEAALLIVDISQGIREQTRRHCYILRLLGIKQVVVLVNKMDLVDYSRQRFDDMKADIQLVLSQLDITPTWIIPVSARHGENVAIASDKLSWDNGPTVLEALDKLETIKAEEKSLRFPVQDIYHINGQSIAVGRVEAGVIQEGQDVFILPEKKKCKVTKIKKFEEKNILKASVGDCVGICVDDEPLGRGQVLVDRMTASITDSIHANIFWMIDCDYQLDKPITLKCATQETTCRIERIYKRFNAATIEIVEKDATQMKPAEVAEVRIRLEKTIVVDKFADIPEMGRFTLEYEGCPVAGGIIV